jgi:hypothetical protein
MWYEMNDSSVRQVSLSTVLKQSAYMLFYQTTNDHPSTLGAKPIENLRKAESNKNSANTPSIKKEKKSAGPKTVQNEPIIESRTVKKDPLKKTESVKKPVKENTPTEISLETALKSIKKFTKEAVMPTPEQSPILQSMSTQPMDKPQSMPSPPLSEKSIPTSLVDSRTTSAVLYDSQIATWDTVDNQELEKREDHLNLKYKKKFKRPSPWDMEYDQGRQKKRKIKSIPKKTDSRRWIVQDL